jgi:hypothetical protein
MAAQMPIARACARGSGNARLMIASVPGRGTDALGEARPHQHARARCDAAQQGAGPEDAQAGEDDPAVTVQVPHRPAREHERGERERVPVDDPLKAADAGMEADADLRQRDVDDRDVEQHQEVPHAHDDEHGAR